MTTKISKITGQIVGVSRRRFLNGTAGAIATTGAILLPEQAIASDQPLSLEQMARALHETVGRYSGQHAPFFPQEEYPRMNPGRPLGFAMEVLRHRSVDEIQCALKPLIGGAS